MFGLVIPTFNRASTLSHFLSLISKQTRKPDIVVVVNDGSTDGTSAMLKSQYPWVVEIVGLGDWWWTGSVNRGIEYLRSNFSGLEGIVLQNDDTEINVDWFESLVEVHQENPSALIGCVAVSKYSTSVILYAGRMKHKWLAISKKFFVGRNINEFPINFTQSSFDLIGRGIYIPNSVFDKIGMYDEVNFKHRGDTEFPLRARKAGYKLIIAFRPIVKIDPTATAGIDIKKYYSFRDFKARFFDFRSSAYWKYRYYYARTLADSKIQMYTFFVCRMLLHLIAYIVKLKYFKFLRFI